MNHDDSRACHRCFKDKALVNFIRRKGRRGWCDWCGARNVYVLPLYVEGWDVGSKEIFPGEEGERKGDFADPRFREIMRQFTIVSDDVRLAEPSESNSGRYWYDLHLVLVAADRFRITAPEQLGRIRDAALAVAAEGGHRIAALSVMPDHVHMALRGNIERSPEEIALAFQNGLARAAGCRVWQDGFYVGTFSEYDLDVIRRIGRQS